MFMADHSIREGKFMAFKGMMFKQWQERKKDQVTTPDPSISHWRRQPDLNR